MLWIAIITLVAFMLVGMPIVFALAASAMLALALGSDLPLLVVAQRMVGQVDSFTLLAVQSDYTSDRTISNVSPRLGFD